MRRYLFAAAISGVAAGHAGGASADAVDIFFTDTGSGVEITGSGSFDLSGLSLEFAGFDISGFRFTNPTDGGFGLGGGALADFYGIGATQSFGTGAPTFLDPGTGNYFGIAFGGTTGVVVGVDAGYASGDPISFSSSVAGASFASLGIVASPLTITAGQNQINLNFETGVVPLPAAAWMLLAGLLALGAVARRRSATA